jgi:chromosome segregation ATPase
MRNAGRWKPAKRRSAAQRAHIESLAASRSSANTSSTSAQKENHTLIPTTSTHFDTLHLNNQKTSFQNQLHTSELRAEDYKRRLHNETRKTVRAKKQIKILQEKLQTSEAEALLSRTTANITQVNTNFKLKQTQNTLLQTSSSLEEVQARLTSSMKREKKLAMRLARMPPKIANKSLQLKDHGIIREETRDMVRNLVQLGVPMENVSSALKSVAEGLGVQVQGHVSTRSIGRIVLEGGVAAKLQLVHEIEHAPSAYPRISFCPSKKVINFWN